MKKIFLMLAAQFIFFSPESISAVTYPTDENPYCVNDQPFGAAIPKLPTKCFSNHEEAEEYLRTPSPSDLTAEKLQKEEKVSFATDFVTIYYSKEPVPATYALSSYTASGFLGNHNCNNNPIPLLGGTIKGCLTESALTASIKSAQPLNGMGTVTYSGAYRTAPVQWFATTVDAGSNRFYSMVDFSGNRAYRALKPSGSTAPGQYNAGGVLRYDFYQCPAGYRSSSIPGDETQFPTAKWPNICIRASDRTIIVPTAQYCSDTKDGNPCVAATGNKEYRETDFEWDGEKFARAYNSVHDMPLFSGLGDNWAHTYSERLSVSASGVQIWIRNDGYYERFQSSGADKFISLNNPGITVYKETDAVANLKGRYRLESKNGSLKWFDDTGKLKRTETGSKILTFSYCTDVNFRAGLCDKSGTLTQILSNSGRKLNFNYTTTNVPANTTGSIRAETRISTIKLNGVNVAAFTYSSAAQLTSVLYGSAGQIPGRQYLYAEPAQLCKDGNGQSIGTCNATFFPNQLTGVMDERNIRFATYTYDQAGRVTSSKHATDAGTTRLNYVNPIYTEVTLATGAKKIYTLTKFDGGLKKPTGVVTQNSLGLVTSSLSSTYGAYNLLASRTIVGGAKIRYEYDNFLIKMRVVGLAQDDTYTPETRLEQTDWHPTFNLPIEQRVLNADLVLKARINYVYNARRQITATCEVDVSVSAAISYVCGSATNAPTGVRQSTTRYCEPSDISAGTCPLEGLVIGTDGPRTDVSDTASYTYRPSDASTCATTPATCAYRKGDLWKMTRVVGGISHITEYLAYDGAGRALQVKDANGVITDATYDTRGWLTASKVRGLDDTAEYDDAITLTEYDGAGLAAKITYPDGDFARFNYDDAQRLIGVSDSSGNSIAYTLDSAGNRTAEVTKDPGNNITRRLGRVFDTLGRLEVSKNAADAVIGTLSYDEAGNLKTSVNALGSTDERQTDMLGRLRKTIQAVGTLNATTEFLHDINGNLAKVIDPELKSTVYGYNGLNDQTSLNSPDTGLATFTYDSAGNRITQRDAKTVLVTNTFDELGRPRKITYTTAALNSEFFYDTVNGICGTTESFAKGHLVKFTDPSGNTQYCYDRFGNMTQKRIDNNGVISNFAYVYTRAGRLTTLTYPSGMKVNYARNNIGQVYQVSITQGTTTKVFANNITYYPYGPLSRIEFLPPNSPSTNPLRVSAAAAAPGGGGCTPRPGGCTPVITNPIVQTRVYDQNYAIQSVGGLNYSIDNQGNIKSITDTVGGNAFDYDKLDRLKFEKDSSTQNNVSAYNYDGVGNRLSKTLGNGNTQNYFYYGGSHRLNRADSAGFDRVYDANGNSLQTASDKYFTYDERNRMVDFRNSPSGIVSQYQYNAKGERVRKYLGATDQANYTFNENGQLLVEAKTGVANNIITQEIIWLDDMPIAVSQNGDLNGILTDHLNTPRQIFRISTQVTQWRWNAVDNAFGEIAAINSGMEFDLRFPGQIYDNESGMHYNYFRDYEPGTGRYLQPDPIGLEGGISLYGYVEGNSLRSVDPLGLEGLDPLWGAIYNATGGWSASQGQVDFFAGAGDVILFGQGQRLRDSLGISGGVNLCSKEYSNGEWAGIVASFATGFAGGAKAAGGKAVGMEFSHSFPARYFNPASKSYKSALDNYYGWASKTILNGNYVKPMRHYFHDPFRYPKGWREFGAKWPSFVQQLDRIPNVFNGGLGGAAYGATGAAINSECGCSE